MGVVDESLKISSRETSRLSGVVVQVDSMRELNLSGASLQNLGKEIGELGAG